MSQFEMPTINPTTYSGTDLAADLNAWSDSVLSGNSGTSRPSYAVAGTPWYNTSTSKLKLYDGSVDFTIPYGNITTYGTSLIESADATAARTLLACAPLASPAFTGTPTAPTQTAGDNSTKLATTAYVDNAVSGLTGPEFKASIILNGTGTISVISSFNIDSVTDDGVGLYTITLTNAMDDADYGFFGSVGKNSSGAVPRAIVHDTDSMTKTTTQFQFAVEQTSDGTRRDEDYIVLYLVS